MLLFPQNIFIDTTHVTLRTGVIAAENSALP